MWRAGGFSDGEGAIESCAGTVPKAPPAPRRRRPGGRTPTARARSSPRRRWAARPPRPAGRGTPDTVEEIDDPCSRHRGRSRASARGRRLRGSVEADVQPRHPETALDHPGGAPFTVRSGDLYHRQPLVWLPEVPEELARGLVPSRVRTARGRTGRSPPPDTPHRRDRGNAFRRFESRRSHRDGGRGRSRGREREPE